MATLELIDALGGTGKISRILSMKQNRVAMWKQRGIPSRWRPTIWALLEARCPEVAASMDRDVFLNVRLPADEDAA
ncbi:MAG: hypothetical protein V3U60_16585 [Gammaproteobacteria bacterium]